MATECPHWMGQLISLDGSPLPSPFPSWSAPQGQAGLPQHDRKMVGHQNLKRRREQLPRERGHPWKNNAVYRVGKHRTEMVCRATFAGAWVLASGAMSVKGSWVSCDECGWYYNCYRFACVLVAK